MLLLTFKGKIGKILNGVDKMIQKPKGTYDILGDSSDNILYLKKIIEALMDKYNYKYFKTPMFEASELFHRGVGETTDIVNKETYDFKDRGGRDMTLRPEGTAGIVRSFIENKLYVSSMPVKAWYFGSMFRYERPQAGRYREFMQFGIEAFGADDPIMDAEVISIMVNFFKILGLKGIKVNINSLGDKESRENYRKALLDYFKPYVKDLCEDCRNRYEKNPLRILDCKVDSNKDIMKNAPKLTDYLNENSKNHLEKVKTYLNSMNIDYIVNPSIVRGLDYYTHTVFEVEANIKGFGSQNVLGAGGRYDHLVENVGGPSVPGVGFAIGIERLMLALQAENIKLGEEKNIDLYAFGYNLNDKSYLMNIVNLLRMNGFNVEMDYLNRNIKNNFKKADKLKAKFIMIVGEEEMEKNIVTIKNNKTEEEFKMNKENIVEFLDSKLGGLDES